MVTKSITQDQICQAALQIITTKGLDKLSMRNLAEKLQIQAPSLYQHIHNKSHLIELIQAYSFKAYHLVGDLNPDCPSWQEYIYQILQNMRQFFVKNPALFKLFAAYSANSPEARQTFESFLQTMLQYGFSLSQASHIGRAMRIYVLGHVQFELSSLEQGNYPLIDPQFPLNYRFFMLDGGYNHHESFEFGAQLLIAGCEKLLEANQ